MSERKDDNGLYWWIVVLFLLVITWFVALNSYGQCLELVPPLMFDTSGNSSAHPNNPRIHGIQQMEWGGKNYLVGNIGNRMTKWDITDPANPGTEARGPIFAWPSGDRDYTLFNFSICDDCKYGVVGAEVSGTIIWSWGTSSVPLFSAFNHMVNWGNVGGFTYKEAGQQYLVLNKHPNGCTGAKAGVFRVEGIGTGDQTLRQCLQTNSGGAFIVHGGIEVSGYIYLVDANMVVRIYRINGDQLDYVSEPIYGFILHGSGIRLDGDRLISATPLFTRIYDVSDPANPVQMAELTMPIGYANVAAISWGNALTATKGTGTGVWFWQNGSITDNGFWDISNPWNSYPRTANYDVEFRGEYMFFARFSTLQRIRVCNDLIFEDGVETGDTSKWDDTQ